jgi:hypothetical protein
MKSKNLFKAIVCILGCAAYISGQSQPVPAKDENIPYLVTFGGDADKSWGDDDFCQIFFFRIPITNKEPFYFRIFDPDIGGALDEQKGEFNTIVRFSIYGGKGAWSNKGARVADQSDKYESGNLVDAKSFGVDPKYDQKWYTFGPINPMEGELSEELNGYIFKVIAKGVSGDDGNLYKYFLSTDSKKNIPIEGGNLFTYKYHFRLSDNQNDVSQIYPYIDDKVISVKIMNYDWDDDGFIRVVSVAKMGELCKVSGQGDWATTELPITKEERNTSLEIQFIKNKTRLIRNNNVAVIIQNQYGVSLPFYVIPIGGIPVYKPSLKMKAVEKK